MESALGRHNALLHAAITQHVGVVFHTAGDAFCAAFASASEALAATIDAQRALAAEDWSACGADFPDLRVRMGLHTGTVERRDGDYFGPPLNRTARLMAVGHGGQILLALATQQLIRDELPPGCSLRDLGLHRLKDLRHSEHIFRLTAPGYPDVATPPATAEQLSTGERLHMDVDAPFFFEREAFTELLVESVAAAPMVGVIGPSGSGKSSVVFAGLVPQLRQAGNGTGG
jgi:hypothetical protein